MAVIYTGISGLKRVNSLLKGKVKPPRIPIEKSEQLTAPHQAGLTPEAEKTIASEIGSNSYIHLTGVKDKRIQELISHRLACDKAIRLKQEIRNFSAAWISRLS